MAIISPTVLAENADVYKQQMEMVMTFAERVQVDITDGMFAQKFTVGVDDLWWPEELKVDIHAMVQRPEDYLVQLIRLKPNMVIFHAEAEGDMPAILATLKQYKIKAGIALQRPTVPSNKEAEIREADHVMIFSGNLGSFGGQASLMQLEKVRLIKRINPDAEIGWDGGVTVDNAYGIKQGGVDVLNVGSSIHNSPDPKATYDTLVTEINKKGVF